MARQRLGVALLFPPAVAVAVDALRRACGDGALGRIPPHLTLVPPVNVREADVPAAVEVLRAAAAATSPFDLVLGPPATFLPDTPVLHLEVGGDVDAVVALRDRVFVPPLERALTWPFVPHVTVADEMAHARIAAAVEALADARFVVPFDRVHLLREERDDEGRRVWRPVADVAFGRPAVVGRGGLELTITEGGALDRETAAWLAREWDRVHEATRPDEAGWDQRPFSLTARRDGRLVGAATGWTNLGAAYLAELVVEAGARGEGVGSHLLAAVEDLARRRGCHTMGLMTEADGAARRLYERRGWTIEWVQEDWIAGRDWARMRRDL